MEESDEYEDDDEEDEEYEDYDGDDDDQFGGLPSQSLVQYDTSRFEPENAFNSSGVMLPMQLGLDTSKVQIMNSVFFDAEYRDEDGIRRVAQLYNEDGDPDNDDDDGDANRSMLSAMESPFRKPKFRGVAGHVQTPVQSRPGGFERADGEQGHETDGDSGLSGPLGRNGRINVEQIVIPVEKKMCLDGSVFRAPRLYFSQMRHSFRAGFGALGRFAQSSSQSSMREINASKSDSMLFLENLQPAANREAILMSLRNHKQHFWGTQWSDRVADDFVKQNWNTEELTQYERHVWMLVGALWGLDESNHEANGHREIVTRRKLVGAWIEQAVKEDVELDQAQSTMERLFVLLSGHRIDEALQECVSSDNLRLGAIIASCASTHESKRCLVDQLGIWNSALIDKHETLLLEMISGGNSNVFRTLESWRLCLGVFFWYRFAGDLSVDSVMRGFENYFLKQQPPVQHSDFCFNLLKLYSQPTLAGVDVFIPESYGSNPLDFRLAWTVRSALVHLPQRAKDNDAQRIVLPCASDGELGARLTSAYAAQLEQLGMWPWAVYVLLVCPDLQLKRTAVRAQLERGFGNATEDDESFLTSMAVGPYEWLSEEIGKAKHLAANSGPRPVHRDQSKMPSADSVESYLAGVFPPPK